MDITISVPDPRFKPGDCCRKQSPDVPNAVIFCRVESLRHHGTWNQVNDLPPNVVRKCGEYAVAVQARSVNAKGEPIRPGTIFVYRIDEFDKHAEPATIVQPVSPDTPENFMARIEAWEQESKRDALEDLPEDLRIREFPR